MSSSPYAYVVPHTVDIIFAHRDDPEVSILEIVRAFNWLISQGKALYWATSMWSVERIEQAHRASVDDMIA